MEIQELRDRIDTFEAKIAAKDGHVQQLKCEIYSIREQRDELAKAGRELCRVLKTPEGHLEIGEMASAWMAMERTLSTLDDGEE